VGTLYPDVIESFSPRGGPSVTIKTHHNVGGLRPDLPFQLIEPLRELFKDEVRQVGRELGLPEEMVGRHPFPGPGLAIRVLGAVTPRGLDVLRQADAIYLEEIRDAGLYDRIWQAFAVLLPVQAVGVMGDARTYENVVALRAVTSVDGMTADWFAFPPDVLGRISNRIINEVRGVNRVVYDVRRSRRDDQWEDGVRLSPRSTPELLGRRDLGEAPRHVLLLGELGDLAEDGEVLVRDLERRSDDEEEEARASRRWPSVTPSGTPEGQRRRLTAVARRWGWPRRGRSPSSPRSAFLS
jgi:hypothetical protein